MKMSAHRDLIVCVIICTALFDEALSQADTHDNSESMSTMEGREESSPSEVDIETESAPKSSEGNSEKADSTFEWVEATGETEATELDVDQEGDSQITRGPKYVLEKILLEGNRKTLDYVILRYIELQPGEVFRADDPRLEEARYRLLALGLFHDVELSLMRGSKRGQVILLVVVKERNTIVLQDSALGFSEISNFYMSLDVAERSFLGSGTTVSVAGVFSLDKQFGYRLRFSDDHFLNSDFGLHVEGLYADARDFFGKDNVQVEWSKNVEYQRNSEYAVMKYRRAGGHLGTSYAWLLDSFFTLDYRFEIINADVPKAGYHTSFGEVRPIEFGHLLYGRSVLSSVRFGLVYDTRDNVALVSTGTKASFEVEVSTEMIGSDYEFSKFTLSYDNYFPLVKGHSIKLGLFSGLIMGDSPFFNQFFVGDFSSFIPSRVLEMNFSHLQPSLLETTIQEMRYEDLAGAINVEYSLPFYRGHGFLYGVNGFVGFGIYLLASREDFKVDPKGYEGYQVVPMDLTADIGVKFDTEFGLFVISLANLLRLIPGGDAAAEE